MQEVSKRNLEVLQQEMEQNAAEAKNSITEELWYLLSGIMNDKGKRGYNTNHHSAIGMSPFEALYGYSPTPLTFLPTAKTSIATVYGFFL